MGESSGSEHHSHGSDRMKKMRRKKKKKSQLSLPRGEKIDLGVLC